MQLTGKTALVTGAQGLLGREHCQALAEAGAFVWGADTQTQGADLGLGSRFEPLPLDVRDPQSLEAAVRRVKARGGLDILVNNAALNDKVEGSQGPVPFEQYPLDRWQRELDVNLTGVFLCCQHFGPLLPEGGSIINVASTYALVAPDPELYRDRDGRITHVKSPAYGATKAAVLALTRYLAAYWGPKGIRVNALCPGGVENGQNEDFIERYAARTPLGRMAHPGDYRGALVFLSSEASRYMTGAPLVVDGGWTAW